MKQIAVLLPASGPAGVPQDPEDPISPDLKQAFADVADLADDLAGVAQQIPSVVAGRTMTDENRRGFNAEAAELRSHAESLGRAARDRKVEGMQQALQAVNSSCIACHSRYRDMSGALEPRRFSRAAE